MPWSSRRRGMVSGLLLTVALWALPVAGVAPAPEAEAMVVTSCPSGPSTAGGVARFWTTTRTCYRSPWFGGSHRVMIPFGCTSAPYYPRVASCGFRGGVHHGIDVDMPRGTPIFSNVTGRVVKGTLGSAYGPKAFLIRTARRDYVLGHVGVVYVSAGERVSTGQLVARSDRLGAPDGPHLHFEVRPRGGSFRSAIDPTRALHLNPADGGPHGCC